MKMLNTKDKIWQVHNDMIKKNRKLFVICLEGKHQLCQHKNDFGLCQCECHDSKEAELNETR